MGNTVRSAKGVAVDFDYLKIKQQLASAPAPVDVKTRQNFIENRLKRRLKKKPVPAVEPTQVEVAPTLPEPSDELLVTDEVVAVEEPQIEEVATSDVVQTIKQPAKRKTVKKKAE